MKINQELYKRFLNEEICLFFPLHERTEKTIKIVHSLIGKTRACEYYFYDKGWFRACNSNELNLEVVLFKEFFINDSTSMIEELFPDLNNEGVKEFANNFKKGTEAKVNLWENINKACELAKNKHKQKILTDISYPNTKTNEVMGGNRLNSNNFVSYATDLYDNVFLVCIDNINSTFTLCPILPCNVEFTTIKFKYIEEIWHKIFDSFPSIRDIQHFEKNEDVFSMFSNKLKEIHGQKNY